ncbi:MAG: RNA polymerase sigma-70 factor (ECF subfamily) [Acidimicrobiales bacterium]|jgi:RNA polymerase sigma-70 factor (ECF subfamily)
MASWYVLKYNGFRMVGQRKKDNIKGSHEERFLKAFEEFSDALFRHAFLRISDRERAIDVVHDTFTKVWAYVRNGHEVDQFRPFLYKVLNNLIIDEYRKAKEASLDALMAIDGIDEGTFDELSENTVESLAATLDGKKAFEMLQDMPDTYSEVIILKFVDGLGPKEIAGLLEESENVISVRLHRGLKMMRDKIEEKEREVAAKLDKK